MLGTIGGVELAFADLGVSVEMGLGLLAAQRSFSRKAVGVPELVAAS